jgi:hypothetical protein
MEHLVVHQAVVMVDLEEAGNQTNRLETLVEMEMQVLHLVLAVAEVVAGHKDH